MFLMAVGLTLANPIRSGWAYVQEIPDDARQRERTISGVVTGVARNSIGIEYDVRDGVSYEMNIPVDEKTQFNRIQSVRQLKRGDRIEVSYRQRYGVDEGGNEVIYQTVASSVTLLGHAQMSPSAIPTETYISEDH
jgi:hypothetical protein